MQQKYTGKSLIKDTQETGLAPYIPSDGLVDAVNLMLLLSTRPLLLMGEPGCGKTSLAKAVAFDLYKEKYQDYYFELGTMPPILSCKIGGLFFTYESILLTPILL